MFELDLKVSVESKEGHPGQTTVERAFHLNGAEHSKESKTFSNVFEAYMWIGDYFFNMVDELAVKSGIVTTLLTDVAGDNPPLN